MRRPRVSMLMPKIRAGLTPIRFTTAGRPAVVVKMDIESAEYDVLPDMLDSGTIDLVTLRA
jgi:hypothetical protein